MNYPDIFGNRFLFEQIHSCKWNEKTTISKWFTLTKIKTELSDWSGGKDFNLIYYDAFPPNVQPELWTGEVFDQLYGMLAPGGALVTYSSKGDVRRAMMTAGFHVEKLKGPLGKREMIRAIMNRRTRSREF